MPSSRKKQLHAGATLQVQACDRANSNLLATGSVSGVDNQINTTTGTVNIRATFPNDDESLFPNQFVNARLLVDTLQNVVRVPVPRGATRCRAGQLRLCHQTRTDTVSVLSR